MTTGWQILRHFLIRAAGFPFGLIGGLAFEQSAAAIEQLLDYEDRLTALGARMHDLLHVAGDAEGAAVRRRCAKRVRQFRPIAPNPAERAVLGRDPLILIEEWDDAVSRREDARAHAAATFAAELTQRRSALREIAADGRFQEAVWLSSPTMLDRGVRRYVSRSAGAGELRRIERQVISYLQRFCAKNETASFFGPVDYGEFIAPDTTTSCGAQGGGPVARSNQAADDPHRAVAGAGTVRHREAFFAHWAVVVLADALAAHPLVGPHLRPRPTALYRLDPAAGTVQFPGTRCRLLDPAELGVLALADADMTITDIACQLGWPPGDVLRVATGLADAKLLTIAPRPPICEVHPLGWLRDWLAAAVRIDGRLSDVLAELDVMRSAEERFGAAPFDAKRALLAEAEQAFTSLTSARPRRGGGSFYADRLLLYEEACGGAGPLRLGVAAYQRVRDRLAPVLDFYAGHAHAVAVTERTRAARCVAGFAANGELPLLRAVPLLRGSQEGEPVGTAWQRAVLAQLSGREDERQVDLDPAALPVPDQRELDGEVLLTSPDVMFATSDPDAVRHGTADLVIGECHDTMLVWGWPLRFHPDAAAVEREGARAIAIAAAGRGLANVLPSRRAKIIPFEYPGFTIELSAPSSRPDTRPLRAEQVTVAVRDAAPVLRAPGTPELRLYNGELRTAAHRALGLPRVVPPALDAGQHTPRLRIGDVIVQRERWRLPRAALFAESYPGDSFELFVDYARARRRLGLPRHLFARVDGEPKPVYVDGHNWFLLQLLRHLLAEDRAVVLTEMLPDPDQLWLRGHSGSFCAELRLSAYRVPATAKVAEGDSR